MHSALGSHVKLPDVKARCKTFYQHGIVLYFSTLCHSRGEGSWRCRRLTRCDLKDISIAHVHCVKMCTLRCMARFNQCIDDIFKDFRRAGISWRWSLSWRADGGLRHCWVCARGSTGCRGAALALSGNTATCQKLSSAGGCKSARRGLF